MRIIRYTLILGIVFFAKSLLGQLKRTTHSKPLMGTTFTIIIYSQDASKHDKVASGAFNEIARINKIFSTYDSTSEVSQLNSTSKWMGVSDELLELILYAEELNQRSNGAFDIKIGKTTDQWKVAFKSKTAVDQSKIDHQKKEKRRIRLKGNYVKTNRHTVLDFGGIAKGYAVDMAFVKMKQLGYNTVLIDGGGDIRLGDSPPKEEGWKIGQFYENGEILFLSNCAIATSGHDYQYIENEMGTQSHIIDPSTLQGLSADRGVSVIASSCKEADALATALSVSGDAQNLFRYYEFRANIREKDTWTIKQF